MENLNIIRNEPERQHIQNFGGSYQDQELRGFRELASGGVTQSQERLFRELEQSNSIAEDDGQSHQLYQLSQTENTGMLNTAMMGTANIGLAGSATKHQAFASVPSGNLKPPSSKSALGSTANQLLAKEVQLDDKQATIGLNGFALTQSTRSLTLNHQHQQQINIRQYDSHQTSLTQTHQQSHGEIGHDDVSFHRKDSVQQNDLQVERFEPTLDLPEDQSDTGPINVVGKYAQDKARGNNDPSLRQMNLSKNLYEKSKEVLPIAHEFTQNTGRDYELEKELSRHQKQQTQSVGNENILNRMAADKESYQSINVQTECTQNYLFEPNSKDQIERRGEELASASYRSGAPENSQAQFTLNSFRNVQGYTREAKPSQITQAYSDMQENQDLNQDFHQDLQATVGSYADMRDLRQDEVSLQREQRDRSLERNNPHLPPLSQNFLHCDQIMNENRNQDQILREQQIQNVQAKADQVQEIISKYNDIQRVRSESMERASSNMMNDTSEQANFTNSQNPHNRQRSQSPIPGQIFSSKVGGPTNLLQAQPTSVADQYAAAAALLASQSHQTYQSQKEQYKNDAASFNEALMTRKLIEQQNQIIMTLMQKLEDVEHKMRSQEKSLRIFDEMHLLKKEEQKNQYRLFEQQIADLAQRQQETESKISDQSQVFEQIKNKISQDLPLMITKTQDRLYDKIENAQNQIKQDSDNVIAKNIDECNLKNQNMVAELRNQTHNSLVEVDKKLNEAKNDVGKQLHEMCSMVEQLATMSRGLEFQLNSKKPEIESASMNIANMQRKMDEQQRQYQNEFNVIRKRQYDLTQLYSTCLESDDNPIGGGIINNSKIGAMNQGQAKEALSNAAATDSNLNTNFQHLQTQQSKDALWQNMAYSVDPSTTRLRPCAQRYDSKQALHIQDQLQQEYPTNQKDGSRTLNKDLITLGRDDSQENIYASEQISKISSQIENSQKLLERVKEPRERSKEQPQRQQRSEEARPKEQKKQRSVSRELTAIQGPVNKAAGSSKDRARKQSKDRSREAHERRSSKQQKQIRKSKYNQ